MRSATLCIATMLIVAIAGCNQQLPAIKPPAIDASKAASAALEQFDTNLDGNIAKEEACAGMRKAWERYDRDSDGTVSFDEIERRFAEWGNSETGMMNLPTDVSFRGRPLANATIEMTPYEFLGDSFKPAKGKTDRYGTAFMEIPKEHLPKHLQMAFGVQTGLYRISITHPDVKIPAKYNVESELSIDLAPADSNARVRFDLK